MEQYGRKSYLTDYVTIVIVEQHNSIKSYTLIRSITKKRYKNVVKS